MLLSGSCLTAVWQVSGYTMAAAGAGISGIMGKSTCRSRGKSESSSRSMSCGELLGAAGSCRPSKTLNTNSENQSENSILMKIDGGSCRLLVFCVYLQLGSVVGMHYVSAVFVRCCFDSARRVISGSTRKAANTNAFHHRVPMCLLKPTLNLCFETRSSVPPPSRRQR